MSKIKSSRSANNSKVSESCLPQSPQHRSHDASNTPASFQDKSEKDSSISSQPDKASDSKLGESVLDEPRISTSKKAVQQPMDYDIGNVIDCTKSSSEVTNAVSNLSDAQKYTLLTQHFQPTSDYIFRSKFIHKCQRSCSMKVLTDYPWLVYSDALDGVFCIHCALFAMNRQHLGQFVNNPFSSWHKTAEKCTSHAKTTYHRDAMILSNAFRKKHERPDQTLPHRISTEKASRIATNRHIIREIIQSILFCGKQGIALRGHVEDQQDDSNNPGNFLALLQLKACNDEILKKHLEMPLQKTATYKSPQIQNELIDIIGNILQKRIVSEIIESKFYSVSADEVTSHNKEILPLCVRYVNKNRDIKETFLEYIHLPRIRGKDIGNAIINTLQRLHIPLENMRAQCYDGASNMSSANKGAQKVVQQYADKAVYVHCSSHRLNLVIVSACGQIEIRNTVDKVKSVSLYFGNSPKRQNLLRAIVDHDVQDTTKRKPLLELCKTRWAARHEAYQRFYQAYVFIVQSLEFIAHRINATDADLTEHGDWDTESRKQASSLLGSISSFDFIINFLIVYQWLSGCDGIAKELQGRDLDIMKAHEKVSICLYIYLRFKYMAWKNYYLN